MTNLSYIFERTRSVYEITPPQQIQVKGENFILNALKNSKQVIDYIHKQNNQFDQIAREMAGWINYLDTSYKEAGLWRVYINQKDARELAQKAQSWMSSITEYYNKSDTVLIQEQALFMLYDDLKNALDTQGQEDLSDGIYAIADHLSTPAVMIIFRVAENIIRKFYEKVLDKEPGNKTWGQMINDFEESDKIDKTLLEYLKYLNKHRIDAAHPYRRYSQEESERILLKLKDLIQEINS